VPRTQLISVCGRQCFDGVCMAVATCWCRDNTISVGTTRRLPGLRLALVTVDLVAVFSVMKPASSQYGTVDSTVAPQRRAPQRLMVDPCSAGSPAPHLNLSFQTADVSVAFSGSLIDLHDRDHGVHIAKSPGYPQRSSPCCAAELHILAPADSCNAPSRPSESYVRQPHTLAPTTPESVSTTATASESQQQ
jgi:hypothetical protein